MKNYILPLMALVLGCQGSPNITQDSSTPAPAPGARTRETVMMPDSGPSSSDASVVVDSSGGWSLHFSPNGGCENAIVSFIGTAKADVHLMAYGFTEETVAQALVARKTAGLDVEVVLDKSDVTAKNSMAATLKAGGVAVFIDSKHRIMHDKVIVVDGTAFESGSYNFTSSAEKNNAENCLIEQDAAKAGLYEQNFQVHKAHSEPY